jgi:hypothetical protein
MYIKKLLFPALLLTLFAMTGCSSDSWYVDSLDRQPIKKDEPLITRSSSSPLMDLFQRYVQGNNIPHGQEQYNELNYISGRADLYCSLLAARNYNKIQQEIPFPPVGNMRQNSSNSSRLEVLIIDAAVQTVCTDQKNNWMGVRQNFAR